MNTFTNNTNLARAARSLQRFYSTNSVKPTSNRIIGIDLGTTNSCVAVGMGNNEMPRVLESVDTGQRTTPSFVAFKKGTNEKLIGEPAKRQAAINPKGTFYATKRLIGKKFNDPNLVEEVKNVSYEIVRHTNGDAWVKLPDGQTFSPSQIGAFVLQKMKEIAESHLHETVDKAVITVPAYFDDSQRNATKAAGMIAGLDVKRIINEPTAASLAYGCADRSRSGTVAVFDLGGGTFDISILDINDGVFQVRATNGDTHLGGEDFDHVIARMILEEFQAEEGIDLSKDPIAMGRIKEAAENAKKELDHGDAQVQLPFIAPGKNLEVTISKDEFEAKTKELIERSLEACKRCAKDAGLSKPMDVDEVVLVGGQTRMPKVKEAVMNLFGKLPNKSVNPDECVAIGAAIQGSVLEGTMGDIMLVDVTPLSLGTATVGDVFSRIIPRNTSIPISKTQTYTTTEDNQTSMSFPIYQGEREKASENRMLGQFHLTGITPAPKGIAKVELTYSLDANGIVNCTAIDSASGNKAHCTVQSSSGLTDSEIERMVKEAEMFAEQDRQFRELAEMKNEGQSVLHHCEDALGKLTEADGLTKEKREEAQKAIQTYRDAVKNNVDFDTLKTALETLKQNQSHVSTLLYKKQSSANKSDDSNQ